MTLKEEVYDVLMLAEKFGITVDSLLEEDYIAHKIHNYREIAIIQEYQQTGLIDPQWIQDNGNTDTTSVNSSDDRAIESCNCNFSKVTLPKVIPINDLQASKNSLGVYRIGSVCGKYQYYEISISALREIPDRHHRKLFKHFCKIGESYYITPDAEKIRPLLILSNPMEGFVLQTENVISGTLTVGQSYTVITGQAIHNAIPYTKGQSFTAVSTIFTGTAVIRFTNEKRAITETDQYPCSRAMMQEIVFKILTQDFKIEQQMVADIKQDGTDPRLLQRSN